MVYFAIDAPKSSHAREDRGEIVARIRAAVPYVVAKRRYRTDVVLHGDWDNAKGHPRERNTDRVVQVLFDAMAEAFGWGQKGRGDNWLDRDYRVTTVDDKDREWCEVTLWPSD